MKTIIKLNEKDIIKIVSEHFGVPEDNVYLASCGDDKGDGIYPGRGRYVNMEVEKADANQ